MAKALLPPSRAAALAAFWRVHLRTAQRWLAEPGRAAAPPTPPLAALDDPAAMLAWVASLPSGSQAKLTPGFRARVDLFRMALDRGEPLPTSAFGASAPPPSATSHPASPGAQPPPPRHGAAPVLDPDYQAFLATLNPTDPATGAPLPHAAAPRDKTLLADLKLQAAYAVFQLQRAQTTGRLDRVKDALEAIRHLSGVIHDEELRAQKLGREAGDILPRPEAARLARALLYWLLRAHDDLLAHLAPRLAAASATGPLYREEVRRLLESATLPALVLAPFARAAQLNAGHALPPWLVDTMRAAAAATLEDGAALFDTLYASPIPIHPIQATIPIIGVTTGPSSDGPSAVAPPSDHGPADPKPAGEATATHSQPGSVSNQTAGNKNNQ